MIKGVQYVTDENGDKTAVILPLDEFEELLEDVHFSKVAEESIDEPRRSFSKVVEEMRTAGQIDVLRVDYAAGRA